MSLRKADATIPQQISSLTTVCGIRPAGRPASAGGAAWVEVIEAGPDGDCGLDQDNRSAFVRPGTPATADASFLPPGVSLIGDTLDRADNAFSAVFFLALDTRGSVPKLVLYHPDLTPAGDVAGGEVSGWFRLLEASSVNATGFEAIGADDRGLRRISWSTAGASLSERLYTFAQWSWFAWRSNVTTDADNLYVIDGLDIKRRAKEGSGAWETVGRGDAALGNDIALQGMTPTRLIVAQFGAGSGPTVLSSVSESGGALTPLATLSGYAGVITAQEQITYMDGADLGLYTLTRMLSDGTGRSVLATGIRGAPLPVFPRHGRGGNVMPEALLWCEAAPGQPNCHNGIVKSFDLSSGLATVLGSLSLPADPDPWSGLRIETSGMLFSDSIGVVSATPTTGPDAWKTDLYVLRPGVAGSLTRVASGP